MKKEGNKKERLKPCPFCGSDHVGFGAADGYPGTPALYWVTCNECGSLGAWKAHKEHAAAVWNRRVDETGIKKGVHA